MERGGNYRDRYFDFFHNTEPESYHGTGTRFESASSYQIGRK
jgi:hypothetical protein